MKLYVLDLGKIVMMGDNPVTKDEGENPAIPIHAFLLDTPAGYVLVRYRLPPAGHGGRMA